MDEQCIDCGHRYPMILMELGRCDECREYDKLSVEKSVNDYMSDKSK